MFQDHFSERAEAYARSRPTYPASLFAAIAALCQGHQLAWDAGTGNGQAALGLTEHFAAVVASDPSDRQLAHAVPHPRVRYLRAAETVVALATQSVDLVTVAQAAHWLDLDHFFAEVERVLRPGGVLALWCYGLC
ncbi:MAG TPA: class I SAM-dependent methyltransferase, partial [Gemmatimonadales bacterium]|nr:class I SAM-dependent methyltransferase [Gemmatimonadales bacterium]